MPGPWEKYATTEAPAGPWEKYAAPPPATPKPRTLDERQGTSAKGYKPPKDNSYIGKFAEGAAKSTLMPLGPPIQGVDEAVERVKSIPGGLLDLAKGVVTLDPETLGGLAGGAPYALSGLPKAQQALVKPVAAVKAGVREGASAAVKPTALSIKVRGVPIEGPAVPASVAGGAKGAATGAALGAPVGMAAPGAAVGGAIGATLPAIKGFIRGTKAQLAKMREADIAAGRPPRKAVWDGVTDGEVLMEREPGSGAAVPENLKPLELPSGRKPGGIQNQKTVPVATAVEKIIEARPDLAPKFAPKEAAPAAAPTPQKVVPISEGRPADVSVLPPSEILQGKLLNKPGALDAAKAFAEAMAAEEGAAAPVSPVAPVPLKAIKPTEKLPSNVSSAYLSDDPRTAAYGPGKIETNRGNVASTLARKLHNEGITAKNIADLQKADPTEAALFWNNTGRIPGVSKQADYVPSLDTQGSVMAELKRLEAVKKLSTKLKKEMGTK